MFRVLLITAACFLFFSQMQFEFKNVPFKPGNILFILGDTLQVLRVPRVLPLRT